MAADPLGPPGISLEERPLYTIWQRQLNIGKACPGRIGVNATEGRPSRQKNDTED